MTKFLNRSSFYLWRGQDSNLRSSGYEPDELSSSPPRYKNGFGFSLFVSEKPGINHFLKTCKDCLFNVECCDFLPLHTQNNGFIVISILNYNRSRTYTSPRGVLPIKLYNFFILSTYIDCCNNTIKVSLTPTYFV